jgi:hypothetical protein
MDQFTRRIIGFGVHAGNVDGIALCRMFNYAISGQKTVPKYLSTDNDPLFLFERWKANLRILDVAEIKTVPYVPLSHPFVEQNPQGSRVCFSKIKALCLPVVAFEIDLSINSPWSATQ